MNVLLLSNDYTIAVSTAQCLEKEGHRIIMIGPESTRGIALFSFCEIFYEAGEELFISGHELVAVIKNLSRAHACDVLMPADTRSIVFVSRNQQELKEIINIAPVSSHKLIQQLDNKWSFYQLLLRLKQPSPETMFINDKDISKVKNFKFPALTKPLQQTGGTGIIYHQSWQEFTGQIEDLQLPVILQEYIPGRDIDCSVFSIEGEIKAWTIQEHVDLGLEFCRNDEILAVCSNILQPVGHSGVAHFDLRIDARDQSIKTLECNPRFWASVNHSMEAGVNFPQLILRSACRENLAGVASISDNVCFIPTKKKLLLKSILLSPAERKRNITLFNSYLAYIKHNLAAEIFRIIYQKNKTAAGKWFSICMKFRYSSKFRRTDQHIR
ncbi:MAG TPA: ATP-grasp domain-containing protein [Syntrophomonadaceae bacterium]|nr:ATP-grasp domain-containing protein [Syntrophomonadaceae bacterium]HPR93902.1 ATP-grasp domain-containing protein [Syntrophomonadaceae bacterium]